jgi:hypothetical protein
LETKQKIKKAYKDLATDAPPAMQDPALAAGADASELPLPDPLDSLSSEETRQLVMDSLKAAEDELGAKPELTSERQVLIQQALSVHKSKVHILDDISEEQRQKLTFLALQSLKTDPRSMVTPGANSKKKGNK